MHDLFIISAFKDDCIEYPPEKPKIKVLTLTVKKVKILGSVPTERANF